MISGRLFNGDPIGCLYFTRNLVSDLLSSFPSNKRLLLFKAAVDYDDDDDDEIFGTGGGWYLYLSGSLL
jgi:hypothetical protein